MVIKTSQRVGSYYLASVKANNELFKEFTFSCHKQSGDHNSARFIQSQLSSLSEFLADSRTEMLRVFTPYLLSGFVY